MKIFRFFAIALVAMLGLTACDKEPEHIYDDHSADLAGTWTCLTDGFAEALVISADGTVLSTGVVDGEYWENVAGTIKVENSHVELTFEDGDNFEGHFDIIAGTAFAITNPAGGQLIFKYCAEDLADEVVGMWVCNDGPAAGENDMVIQTFDEDGTVTKTGWSVAANEFIVKEALTYKVVGDLLFHQRPSDMLTEGVASHFASKLTYMPNANQLGDMLTNTTNKVVNGNVVELSMSMLRIKQTLELAEKKYDYIKTFVSNVKGLDKDIDFMGYTFNFAKMDGYILDKMLKTLLFTVEFPDANTIKYGCHYNNEPMSMEVPITVDGNKMTVKMSEKNAAFRDIDLYTFQDQDNTQMHMYMPTSSFVNFFGNMKATMMSQLGQLDFADEAAVKAVYDSIDDVVESVNVSFVMTKAAK